MTERYAEMIIKDIDDAIAQMQLSWAGGQEHQLEKLAAAREKLEAAKDELSQAAGNGTFADVISLLKQIERNTAPRTFSYAFVAEKIKQGRRVLFE